MLNYQLFAPFKYHYDVLRTKMYYVQINISGRPCNKLQKKQQNDNKTTIFAHNPSEHNEKSAFILTHRTPGMGDSYAKTDAFFEKTTTLTTQ